MLKFDVTPVAKYRSVTARCSSGGTLRCSLVSCRCMLGPTLFRSNSNDSLSIRRKFLYTFSSSCCNRAWCALCVNLQPGNGCIHIVLYLVLFLASQQLVPSHKPQLFLPYRLPCLFLVPETGTRNLATGTKNWYLFLVPVFCYQFLVSMSWA